MSATRRGKSSLPAQPSLEQLRKQAKQRLAKLRAGGASARLAEAQLLVAREYGYSSWRALKAAVEIGHNSDPYCLPPLNQHRTAASYTRAFDRLGVETAFFNFMAAALLLTCISMTFHFGPHIPAPRPVASMVTVEITR